MEAPQQHSQTPAAPCATDHRRKKASCRKTNDRLCINIQAAPLDGGTQMWASDNQQTQSFWSYDMMLPQSGAENTAGITQLKIETYAQKRNTSL
jgi:hypothetical protein